MLNNIYKSVLSLVIGHLTVFKHAFKKRVTLEYPEVKPKLNHRFRGKHVFDINKCKACGMCQKVCPADAITIVKSERGLESYSIDYGKCIFCGNCAFYCNLGAMKMSTDFELATDDKSELKVVFKKEQTNE